MELKDKISRKLMDYRYDIRRTADRTRRIGDFTDRCARKLADFRDNVGRSSLILKISDLKEKFQPQRVQPRNVLRQVTHEITKVQQQAFAQAEPQPGNPVDGLRVYQKGNSQFLKTHTSFGVCLMGGGRRTDSAFQWFLKKAGGGDLVILRTAGYDDECTNPESLTNILWNLAACNSITTLIVDSKEKANAAYVEQVLKNAEALWIPGGDQTEYYDIWSGTNIQALVKYLTYEKKIPIGGISAGMHVMGKLVHTPYGGNSVISEDALDYPYLTPQQISRSAGITIQDNFFDIPFMENILTDTHWSERNRMGRSLVFLARVIADGLRTLENVRLIACDEGTAICIEQDGTAKIFGSYPKHQDFAYFIKPNSLPNECTNYHPLTWETETGALTVFKIPGDPDGRRMFDVKTWTTQHGEQYQLNIHRGVVEDLHQRRTDIQSPD